MGCGINKKLYSGDVSNHFNGKKFINTNGLKAHGFKEIFKYFRTRDPGEWVRNYETYSRDTIINNNYTDSIKLIFVNHSTFLIQLDTLNIQNDELMEKIEIGAKLQVNSVNTISMKERNNGKLVSTTRASRTDALRISFTIAGNTLAVEGEENALIQVLNPKGEVVSGVGEEALENGETILYTDKTLVEYAKENIDVVSLIEVNRKEMTKGTHTVRVFLNGRIVGVSEFLLK
jgi:hypothetical protein